MKKRIRFFTAISLVLTLLLVWFFYQTEEDKIFAQFDELSRITSKTEDTSTIADALVLDDFRKLFAPAVLLDTGSQLRFSGQYTDQELVQLYGRIRLQAKQLSLRFDNIEIVSVDEAEATVRTEVQAEGMSKRGEKYADSFRVEVHLRKSEGDWLFHQFIYQESLAEN